MSCTEIHAHGAIVHLCTFCQERGRFLFWTWELHSMLGVNWYWMQDTRWERPIFPGRWSPLWWIFYAQHKE